MKLGKTIVLIMQDLLPFKPMSHQGGVFAALSRRSLQMQNAEMSAVTLRWKIHRTPWEILERQGSAFLLDMLKTYAATRRSN